MREGWEMKKLVELGEIQTGTTPSKRNKEFYGDYIHFVKNHLIMFLMER